MKPYARYCIYALICLEIVLYGVWYVTSPRGIRMVKHYKNTLVELEQGIKKNNTNVEQLKQLLQDWNDYPMYHEQQARALQYVFPGDEVYVVKN